LTILNAMATNDLAALKRLLGDEPRPAVTVHRFDRNEVKNSVKKSRGTETLPKVVKAFNSKGKTASDIVKKPTGVKADFTQNPVPDSTRNPYCLVGILFVQSGDSNTYFTGTLVGSNMVLTAGNAIPWNSTPWYMQFIPAYNNGAAPFGAINVSQVWGYNAEGSTTNDYLVCHLETSVGNEIGWFGVYGSGSGSDYQDAGEFWNSVGYPNATVQITATNFGIDNTSTTDGGWSIDLDTQLFIQPGWVGGPVWAQFPFNGTGGDDGPWICGVVAGTSNNRQYQVNEGGNDMVSLIFYGQDNWL
jgi:V8-like Glu-specific endopeptidase